MNDEYERIKKKVDYFARNSLPIHLTKKNKGWLNGWILKVTDDILTVDDYEDGIMDIFLVDIKDIEQFKPPILREDEKNGTTI